MCTLMDKILTTINMCTNNYSWSVMAVTSVGGNSYLTNLFILCIFRKTFDFKFSFGVIGLIRSDSIIHILKVNHFLYIVIGI